MQIARTIQSIAAAAAVALFAAVLAPPAAAMSFDVFDAPACGPQRCIVLSGAINASSVEQFRELIAAQHMKPGALVLLDSDGGDHLQGLALGDEIRKHGFSTEIANVDPAAKVIRAASCASACVYAFLGGVERRLQAKSRLGVHQVTITVETPGQSVSDAQWLMGLVAIHLKQMGCASDVLTLALTTPPQKVRWLSSDELSRFAVVTQPAATGFAD